MNLYVGNLSPKTSEWQLRKAFARYGIVGKISMNEQPRDSDAYGFCFLEMPFDDQASVAIMKLNGQRIGGNAIAIKESGVST